jgi:hypothetical protein
MAKPLTSCFTRNGFVDVKQPGMPIIPDAAVVTTEPIASVALLHSHAW